MSHSREASDRSWQWSCVCYVLATAAWAIGIAAAAQQYPGSYDWAYTVISALASRKHNPEGAAWFAGAIVVAMCLLWPVVRRLVRHEPENPAPPRWMALALQIGVAGAAIVGLERLIFFHFSGLLRKGHELVALVSFLGLYAGIIGLYVHRIRIRRTSLAPAIIVVVPLIAGGLRELILYVGQRGLGWADLDWRGRDTPLWMSFAMWQWLAAGLLWIALGHLLFTARAFTKSGRKD